MRIAICFSGQVRTGVNCANNILKYIDVTVFANVDFFIHTWDIESSLDSNYDETIIDANMDDIIKIKDIYKPKKMIIENYAVHQKKLKPADDEFKYLLYYFPMYQSIYECNELKKSYELENNFKYDYVVRIRPDCVYPSFSSLHAEINYIAGKNPTYNPNIKEIYTCDKWNKLPGAVEDLIWIAKSDVMDDVCELLKTTEHRSVYTHKDLHIQNANILRDASIYVHSFKYNAIEIYRNNTYDNRFINTKLYQNIDKTIIENPYLI